MIRALRGIITFTLILITSILVIIVVVPIGLLRFIPYKPLQISTLKINEVFGELTLSSWRLIQDIVHKPKYEVKGLEKLNKDLWQFTTINHLSWADIFLFLYFTNQRMNVPKIFMKAELWWLPITWAANIGLAMPFVVRRTKEQIRANPELAKTDKESTIRACKMYQLYPTNVCGFIEGTRIDKTKYNNSNSKFDNLMPPKIGGMGYTLEVMPYINHLTDITLVYKSDKRSFWSFLCGDMKEASVTINTYEIPKNLIDRDYATDNNAREELRTFLEEIWTEKDQIIENQKVKYDIKSVF